jgi:hypothetical protein
MHKCAQDGRDDECWEQKELQLRLGKTKATSHCHTRADLVERNIELALTYITVLLTSDCDAVHTA